VREIARLTKTHIATARDLLMDGSYFAAPLEISGVGDSANPYDAPNGALCVNFNTVMFTQRNGKYLSAEPQTPLVPFVINRIRATGLNRGRIVLSSEEDGLLYAGHLFRYFFDEAGIRVTGSVKRADPAPRDGSLLLDFRSPYALDDVISQLLEYSNNYIANQVLITIGIKAFGPPGTLDKGVRALSAYAATVLHLDGAEFVEGSGISHQNVMSAAQMVRALSAFEPHHILMNRTGSDWYKTGHLEDVQTRVGYIEAGDGGLYRYAVLLNTPGKSPDRVMVSIRTLVEQDRRSGAHARDR
jgi:D-alanyl-D-alanine carboxypeptidase/D-alanyl-D-alanine-endopeptidase (penicillin-binding protein 4)